MSLATLRRCGGRHQPLHHKLPISHLHIVLQVILALCDERPVPLLRYLVSPAVAKPLYAAFVRHIGSTSIATVLSAILALPFSGS